MKIILMEYREELKWKRDETVHRTSSNAKEAQTETSSGQKTAVELEMENYSSMYLKEHHVTLRFPISVHLSNEQGNVMMAVMTV